MVFMSTTRILANLTPADEIKLYSSNFEVNDSNWCQIIRICNRELDILKKTGAASLNAGAPPRKGGDCSGTSTLYLYVIYDIGDEHFG